MRTTHSETGAASCTSKYAHCLRQWTMRDIRWHNEFSTDTKHHDIRWHVKTVLRFF